MKECPFCSAPMKEQSRKCRACGKTLMKNLQIDLHLQTASGLKMRLRQRQRPRQHQLRWALFGGLVFSLIVVIGGSIELLSAASAGKEANLISSTVSAPNP